MLEIACIFVLQKYNITNLVIQTQRCLDSSKLVYFLDKFQLFFYKKVNRQEKIVFSFVLFIELIKSQVKLDVVNFN